MLKLKIKKYEAVINSNWMGNNAQVLIGVIQGNCPSEYFWDNWSDNKIYYYLTPEEMENLEVGDVLNDGENFTIVAINKDKFSICEVEYLEVGE